MWGNLAGSAENATNYSLKAKFYTSPFAKSDNCNIKAYVYDEKLSVLINGQTAFESLLSSEDLFGNTYSAKNEIALGIATWDGYLGQPLFQNVKFETGNSVVKEKVENWTYYPSSSRVADKITVDTLKGSAESSEKYNNIKFNGASNIWEISGTLTPQ